MKLKISIIGDVKHTILNLTWHINIFIRLVFISEGFFFPNPNNFYVFCVLYLFNERFKVLRSIKMAEACEGILRSHR